MNGPYDKGTLLARIRELEELYRATQGLLLEANLGLEQAQAEAWDEGREAGYRDHIRWMRPGANNAPTPNPYRKAE